MKETLRKKAMAMSAVVMAISVISMGSSALAEFPTTPNSLTFEECYAGCFILCAIEPTRTLSSCGFECLMNCLIPQNLSNKSQYPFHFCNLGCAYAHCTNISTLNNPGANEVARCVGSCSGLCTKNYTAAP